MISQVGLLNVDGYYNSLLSFIDKAVEEGFVSPSARHIIVSAPTAMELVKKLEVHYELFTLQLCLYNFFFFFSWALYHFFQWETGCPKLLKHLINSSNVSFNMEFWIKAFFFFFSPSRVKNIYVSNIYLQLFTNFRICISLFQEYFPRHEGVASKLNWEIEQLGYTPKCEISM